jgi:lipoprotein-anchoring transpeptidase ErfK/SrfK
MNKLVTSLGIVSAFGLVAMLPAATPSAVGQTTPPTSSQIISTPEAAKPTLVAQTKNGKPGAPFTVYATAGKGAKVQIALKNPKLSRLLFTVVSESGDSYFVNLPTRPNGSKGYVKKADVTTFENPFKITISLTDKRLSAYKNDVLLLATKVAIGEDKNPTPVGEFYTYWIRKPQPGSRGYGVFIIGISAHSDVIKAYGPSGDGRIGLHGTYNDAELGMTVSAGCVRMSNSAITKLKETLPMGTPVLIYK